MSGFLFQQFLLPVFKNQNNPPWYAILKLVLPSFSLWLLAFYAMFHCFLNIQAELCGLADRMFYQDWWNSTTLDTFWRKWNIPVHEWCLRHIYVEGRHHFGMSKTTAVYITF